MDEKRDRSSPEPQRTALALVGRSAAVRAARAQIEKGGHARFVLLEADEGLEPIEIARAIHHMTARGGPFVAAATVDGEAMEDDLFGPGAGAAAGPGAGKVAGADGGTIFVEDLPALPEAAQAQLMRIVRGEPVMVAGTRRSLNVRLAGCVRPPADGPTTPGVCGDLLEAFDAIRIRVPRLRERPEDIPDIVERLLTELADAAGVPVKTMAPPAMTVMRAVSWGANVAELREVVAIVHAGSTESTIQLEDVLPHLRLDSVAAPAAAAGPWSTRGPAGTLRGAREQFERDYIAAVIRQHRGRISEAAKALGLQRTNLYRKARQLGISVSRSSREP